MFSKRQLMRSCVASHFSEDNVVLLNCILDPVGSGQDLLAVLLGIYLNPTDLGSMGPPLPFSTIHLKEKSVSRAINALCLFLSPRIPTSISWVGNKVP